MIAEKYFCKAHLLNNDIAGKEERNCDSNDEEDVVPAFLGVPPHELLVVDAEEEADGEEGEEAAVEYLSHKDNMDSRYWK